MVEPRTQEIYGDIVHYSNVILDILKDYDATNDTPEGRIIYQCEWLIQEVKAGRLKVPEAHNKIHSIRHTYVSGDLLPEIYKKGIERYIEYLIKLSKNKRIMKPKDYPLAIQEIDALLAILNNAPRPLSTHEQGMLPELEEIKRRLSDPNTILPIPYRKPDGTPSFPNTWEIYDYDESTIDDILGAHPHLEKMVDMVFEAERD